MEAEAMASKSGNGPGKAGFGMTSSYSGRRRREANATLSPEQERHVATGTDAGLKERALRFAALQNDPVVIDSDIERAERTSEIICKLAPHLGFSSRSLRIVIDREAAARTNARGAAGLVSGGRIYLNPVRYDPVTVEGRYLLGHELTHIAQGYAPIPSDTYEERHRRRDAEIEARRIGRAVSRNETFDEPSTALFSWETAADTDKAEPPPEPIETAVKSSRARELKRIKNILDTWLWISDGDVDEVLYILEAMPFVTARAVIRLLDKGLRRDLVDNVSESHTKRFRPQVLAVFAALSEEEIKAIQFSRTSYRDVWEVINLKGLSPEEHFAASYFLKNLTDGEIRFLLKSQNKDPIRDIMSSTRADVVNFLTAPGKHFDEKAALKAARVKEEKLAEKERAEQKLAADPAIEAALKFVLDILDDFKVYDSEAIEILNRICEFIAEPAKVDYIAHQMDSHGALLRFLDELPEESRSDTTAHRETFLRVVKAAPEGVIAGFVEKLLSYGVFDWAITDSEAKFAYELIKVLSPEGQSRFRRKDGGKWFLRLEQNIPDEMKEEGTYTGIEVQKGEDGKLRDVTAEYAALLKVEAKNAYEELLALCKKGIDDDTAPKIYTKLAGIVDPRQRDAVARRLDTLGYIDELFGRLSTEFLLNEENRLVSLRIMLARDPIHVERHARDLLDRGFFNLGVVTAREAYLAYQLVRVLPPEEQAAFMEAEDGELWNRILEEMTLEMRESKDLNPYVGDKGGLDNASVLGQLHDETVWKKDRIQLLDGLIRMAIAMGEHRYVFEESMTFTAFKDEELKKRIVDRYALFDDPLRKKYDPSQLKGTTWYQEGVFQTLGVIGQGIDLLFRDWQLLIGWGKLGLKGVPLAEVQDVMGGDIKGVRFTRTGEEVKGRKASEKKETASDAVNKLDIDWDMSARVLEVRVPDLQISAANYHSGSFKFQAGRGKIKGLKLYAHFPGDDFAKSSSIKADAEHITLEDILLIFREAMLGVNDAQVGSLHSQAGVLDPFVNDTSKAEKGSWVPLPLFIPIAAPILYYTIPYLSNLVTILRSIGPGGGPEIAWEAMPLVHKEIRGDAITGPIKKFAIDAAKKLTNLDELEQLMDLLRAADFTFSSLELEGFTTSGGQHIESLSVKDFRFRAGGTRGAYLRARIRSLEERLALAEKEKDSEVALGLTAELGKAKADLEAVKSDEEEMVRLQHKYQKAPGDFKKEDQEKLDALQGKLSGGSVIDIGEFSVKGASGAVSMDELTVKKIHGEGSSPVAGIPFLTDASLIERFKSAKETDLIDKAGGSAFRLSIGELTTRNISLHESIPKRSDLQKRIESVNATLAKSERRDDVKLREYLATLEQEEKLVAEYERYAARGVSSLKYSERNRLLDIRKHFLDKVKYHADTVNLTGAEAERGALGGSATVRTQTLDATGIIVEKLRIHKVSGKDVRVDADLASGFKSFFDPLRNLKKAGLKAESLEFSAIRHDESGAEIKRFSLTSSHAELTGLEKKDANLSFGASIQVEGVSLTITEKLLEAELELLKAKKKRRPTEELDEKIDKVAIALGELRDFNSKIKAAESSIAAAKEGTKERAAAEKEVQDLKELLAEWNRRLGVSGLSIDKLEVTISSLGDILSDNWDLEKEIDKGVRVEGGFASAELSDSKIPGFSGKSVKFGKFGVKANYSADKIELQEFFIQRLELNDVAINAHPHHVHSTGTTVFENITLKGQINSELRKDKYGANERKLSRIKIEHFGIGAMHASGLYYAMNGFSNDGDLLVIVDSGSINGITVDDLSVELPEGQEPVIKGREAGIKGIEDFKLTASIGSSLKKTEGTLSGRNLKVESFSDKEQTIHVGELSVKDGFIDTGSTNIRASVRKFSGTIINKDGTLQLQNIKIERVKVGKTTWASSGLTVVVEDNAVLENVRLDGTVTTEKQGEKRKLTNIRLKELWVNEFKAVGLKIKIPAVAEDKKKGIEASEEKTISLKQGTIKGFRLTDFDLASLKGDFDVASADIDTLSLAFGAEGKRTLETTVSLQGEKISGLMYGPDYQLINLGDLKKISGSFKGYGVEIDKLDVTKTSGIITRSGDNIWVSGLEIGGIDLGVTKYDNGAGTSVALDSVGITGIHLDTLDLTMGKDPDDEKKKKIVAVKLDNLILDKVIAKKMRYSGTTTSVNKRGDTVRTENEIQFSDATINTFELYKLDLDLLSAEKTTILDAHVKSLDVSTLKATLQETVKGKTARTKIATDLTAKEMRANLTMKKMKSPKSGEWTSLDGTFHLDKLGLQGPHVTYTDAEGKTVEFGNILPGKKAIVNLKDLDVTLSPNSAALIEVQNVKARNLGLLADNVRVEVPFLEIKKLAAALKGYGVKDALKVLGAKADELTVRGLKVEIVYDRKKAWFDKIKAKAAGTYKSDPLILEPLEASEGGLTLNYEGSEYLAYPVPIEGGEGVVIVPLPTPGGIVLIQKRLVLRPLVEDVLNEPPSALEPPKERSWLESLGVKGNVIVGPGKVGTRKNYLKLKGTTGITFGGTRVGKEIQAQVGKLEGKGSFEVPTEDGPMPSGADVELLDLRVSVKGLSTLTMTITIELYKGEITNITFGDVGILNPAALAAVPEPD